MIYAKLSLLALVCALTSWSTTASAFDGYEKIKLSDQKYILESGIWKRFPIPSHTRKIDRLLITAGGFNGESADVWVDVNGVRQILRTRGFEQQFSIEVNDKLRSVAFWSYTPALVAEVDGYQERECSKAECSADKKEDYKSLKGDKIVRWAEKASKLSKVLRTRALEDDAVKYLTPIDQAALQVFEVSIDSHMEDFSPPRIAALAKLQSAIDASTKYFESLNTIPNDKEARELKDAALKLSALGRDLAFLTGSSQSNP